VIFRVLDAGSGRWANQPMRHAVSYSAARDGCFQQTNQQASSSSSSTAEAATRTKPRPFSLAEDQRLLEGVKVFGTNWQLILSTYSFGGRTTRQLRHSWRVLNARRQGPL